MTNDGEESRDRERGDDLDGVPGLSDDGLYDALASRRRRRVLYLLREADERTVDELATLLSGWEATETGGMGSREDRDRIAVSLVHVHLPVLDDARLVSYDGRDGTVESRPVRAVVDELIRRSVEDDPSARP